MRIIVRHPVAVMGGSALVLTGLAGLLDHQVPVPRVRAAITVACLVLALAVPLAWRADPPRGWPARISCGLTLVLIVVGAPSLWFPIARWLRIHDSITGGLQWRYTPFTALFLVALLPGLPWRDGDRPVIVRCGLLALPAMVIEVLAVSVGGTAVLPLLDLRWIVAVGLGLAMLGFARWARRPGGPVGQVAGAGAPGVGSRSLVAALLLGSGTALGAGVLVRWHACLGWRWSPWEASCSEAQNHKFDIVSHVDRPGATVSLLELMQGLGLLLLAAALLVIAALAWRTPASSPSATVRRWMTRLLWLATATGMTLLGLTIAFAVTIGQVLAGIALVLDPCGFFVLALLIWRPHTDNTSATERASRRWNLTVVQLLLGVGLTHWLFEFFAWSGIYGSHDTPFFVGLLRALVLLVIGAQLLAPKRTPETPHPQAPEAPTLATNAHASPPRE